MERRINGHTGLLALFGTPVGHSGSPAMYNFSFQYDGLDYAYMAFDVNVEQMPAVFDSIRLFKMRGGNFTMPCKNIAAELVDKLSPAAEIIGACNVFVNDDGVITGHITDGVGFVKNLEVNGVDVKGKKTVVLGAGGAATAIQVQLALDGASEVAIFNIDDEYAGRMIENCICDVETYGVASMQGNADLEAADIHLFKKPGILGVAYNLSGKINMKVEIDVPGKFSVYNSLAAIAICRHFTEDTDKIEKALEGIRVRGRVEILPVSDDFTVMVDYAHNAMSLESLLNSLKEYQPERIITVFGCGGNRDRNRRFEMGEVSSRLSDLSVITSDNPRDEEPMAIIEDILTGIRKADGAYVTIPDRKEAVRYALSHAGKGDIVVIAGKGHEDYQIIKGVKYHMDDRELVEEARKEIAL